MGYAVISSNEQAVGGYFEIDLTSQRLLRPIITENIPQSSIPLFQNPGPPCGWLVVLTQPSVFRAAPRRRDAATDLTAARNAGYFTLGTVPYPDEDRAGFGKALFNRYVLICKKQSGNNPHPIISASQAHRTKVSASYISETRICSGKKKTNFIITPTYNAAPLRKDFFRILPYYVHTKIPGPRMDMDKLISGESMPCVLLISS